MHSVDYKVWLDNEYAQWVKALQSSTVHNFKEHPVVNRMLGNVDGELYLNANPDLVETLGDKWPLISQIDSIGYNNPEIGGISGTCLRMVYYAMKVIDCRPTSIVEIGGGVGQFYAILRALGYKGDYWIDDLREVKIFHCEYLKHVNKVTGLNTVQYWPWAVKPYPDFCCSFYSLGEMDDQTKRGYVDHVVTKCPHGLIIWNPHSGASDKINFPCKIEDEYPLTSPGNKLLTW